MFAYLVLASPSVSLGDSSVLTFSPFLSNCERLVTLPIPDNRSHCLGLQRNRKEKLPKSGDLHGRNEQRKWRIYGSNRSYVGYLIPCSRMRCQKVWAISRTPNGTSRTNPFPFSAYFNFKQHQLAPAHYLPDWLIPLFLDHLDINTCAHVWDVLLLEGDVFLFRVALILLAVLEPGLFFPERKELLELLRRVLHRVHHTFLEC